MNLVKKSVYRYNRNQRRDRRAWRASDAEIVLMQTTVKPATIQVLADLEREMADAQRTAAASAIRDAITILVSPARGWISTGQAAERLGVTVPTVKEWIRR